MIETVVHDMTFDAAITNIRLMAQKIAINKEPFKTQEQTKMWVANALRDMPLWMIWRGTAPFADLEPTAVPAMAYTLLSLANGASLSAIYSRTGSRTLLGAYKNVTMFTDKAQSLKNNSPTIKAAMRGLRASAPRNEGDISNKTRLGLMSR